jgi:glycosyltransferase involved in cell wall biosynthesis
MPNVLIIDVQMKKYRMPFFTGLRQKLQPLGIDLQVAYSEPRASDVSEKDTCDLSPECGLKVPAHRVFGSRVIYQPLLLRALSADLVIVDQANKHLLNHLLLPISRLGLCRLAFWGHGKNCGQAGLSISEKYRRRTLNWVYWWFAYTHGTAKYLECQGVSPSKITVVQNSIDTRVIREYVQNLPTRERIILRDRMGIPKSATVGIFCGRLRPNKSVPFLVESSFSIKKRVPDFHLVIVGGGPEESSARQLANGSPWIHLVGPRFGREKAELLAISDLFLLPGAVGLAILDAFAAGLPFLTTRLETHGPEIEYLREGDNGYMCEARTADFADMVCSVLQKENLCLLRERALRSSTEYSIDLMVENFANGIVRSLGMNVEALSESAFSSCGQ